MGKDFHSGGALSAKNLLGHLKQGLAPTLLSALPQRPRHDREEGLRLALLFLISFRLLPPAEATLEQGLRR